MHIAVVRDVRVEGRKPNADSVLEVDILTPLKWPIQWMLDVKKERKDVRVFLKIMCHASAGQFMIFCTEHITPETVVEFKPWYKKLAGIDLLTCSPAYIQPGSDGGYGDGNVLCSRFAQITGTYVRGSTTAQYYHDRPWGVDWGNWEGTVLTYGPKGDVVKVEYEPLAHTLPGV